MMESILLQTRSRFDTVFSSMRAALGVLVLAFPFAVAQAQSNVLDHFSWSALPDPVQAGAPYNATLQARDLNNNVVTNFNGPALLTQEMPGDSPGILITEVQAIIGHRVELSNLGSDPVDVSGWRLVFYDYLSWPLPRQTFTIPPGTICPGQGIFQVSDNGSAPGTYPSFFTGQGLAWNGSGFTDPVAVLLLDASGRAVDFFCAGEAYPVLISVPMPIGEALWSGLPLAITLNPSQSFHRGGHADHNNAADWSLAAINIGLRNPELESPFSALPIISSLSPPTVTLANGTWNGQVTIPVPGTNILLRADDGSGHSGATGPFTVKSLPALQLQLPSQAFKASPGLVGSGTVSIGSPLSTNLVVSLNSAVPGLIQVPPSVTLPAGSLSQAFSVSNRDDGLVEGALVVSVSASAPGFAQATGSITNYDRAAVSLSVSLPAYITEGTAWAVAAVQASVPVAADVAVTLSSSDPSRLQVPNSVVIHAGQSSASFGLTALSIPYLDASENVTISAAIPGWTSGSGQLLAISTKFAGLSLSLPYQVDESAGVLTNGGLVQLTGLLPTNITVALNSDTPSRVQVPASVVIPSGQSSARFNITIVNDTLTNGNVFARIGAGATGFQGAVQGFTVIDDDLASFSFGQLPTAQLAGKPFAITVSALNVDATTLSSYSTPVQLVAESSSGRATVSPSLVGPFTNGVWSGLVTVTGADQGVVLVAQDSAGHTGSSSAFGIADGIALDLPVSDMVYDPSRGRIWAAVLSGNTPYSQRIVSIDPVSGQQDASINLSVDTGKIAISDDGQFLYVGLVSGSRVVRINLVTKALDLSIPLLTGGPTVAQEMRVLPGDPHSLLVQMFGYNIATAIFRDGVPLSTMAPPVSYANEYHLAFYNSPTNLYCITPGDLRLLNLNASGVNVIRETGDPQYGGEFIYAGGLLYNSLGWVYDPKQFDRLSGYATNGFLAVDAGINRTFFLSGTRLNSFDLASFAPAGFMELPLGTGSATRLLLCPSNLVAVATTATNLLLLQTDLTRHQPAVHVAVSQTTSAPTATIGNAFSYTLMVSNTAATTATNAWVLDSLPSDTTLISATGTALGSWTSTNGLLSFKLGPLAAGATATLQFSVVPTSPGQLVNAAWVVGSGEEATNVSRISSTVAFGPVLPAVTRIRANSDALTYDSQRNLLWTTTEHFNGALDNSFRSFIVSNGLAGPVIPFGLISGEIALSSSQNYLYAAFQRYDPPGQLDSYVGRASLISNIVDEVFGVESVIDLIGVGSHPDGIAVSEPEIQDDIQLYDNGVPTIRTPTDSGSGKLCVNPALPNRIYRLGGALVGGGDVAKFETSSNSIDKVGSAWLLPYAREIRFSNGLLFSDNGLVGDPELLTNLASLPVGGLVQTEPAAGLVYYLVNNATNWTLTAFDTHSFVPLWNYNIPDVSGTPGHLVSCGTGLLAFRTTDDQLYILNTAQMTHSLTADLALSQDPTPGPLLTNQQITFTTRITNEGPGPATGVFVTNQLPPEATIVSMASSQGSCTNLSGTVVCAMGNLASGAAAWVQVTATATRAGSITNIASATSSVTDPLPANNVAVASVDYYIIPVSDLVILHLPPVPGSNLVYTVVVSNAGPDTASDVVLNDSVGLGGNLVSATPSQGTLSIYGNSVSASLGLITNGGTATLSLAIAPCCGAMVLNFAQAGTTNQDFNLNNSFAANVFSFSGGQFADEIPVPATDITYDPAQQRVLAALLAPLGTVTNSIMGIDVHSGSIETVASIGNTLRRVAISDDSHYLYVGIADTGGVARVDLPAHAVDLRFQLNAADAPEAPYYAEDLAVMPGHPTTLAAARGAWAGNYSGLVIFDSGVPRADTIEEGPGGPGYTIAFLDQSNLCSMSEWDVQASAITPTGLTNIVPVMSGFGGGVFSVSGGLVYTSFGKVLDPMAGTELTNYPAQGWIAPDLEDERVYFLTPRSILKAFDSSSHDELWSVNVGALTGSPQHLIRLGTNGLAMTTDANRMFILRPAALGAPMADLALSQSLEPGTVSAGGPLTSTLTVANYGPWTATGIIVSNPIPSNAVLVSATSSQGSCLLTNGAVVCALGSLTNGGMATVSITLSALTAGSVTDTAFLSRTEADPNPANDFATATATVISQPGITIQDAVVAQGSTRTSITFPVTLSGPSSVPVSFAYQTLDGSAIAGLDYDAASGIFSIPAGSLSGSLKLNIIRTTSSLQPLETFYLALGSATNGFLNRTQATGNILVRYFHTVSLSGGSVVQANGGVTNAQFNISLNQTSSVPVLVQFQTVDGTAIGGVDYETKMGTLLFTPGITNLILTVPVFSQPVWAPAKTFSVVLSQPQNAVLGVDEAAGTIVSGQPVPPLVILSAPASQVAHPGANALFSVQATGNPLPLSYQWQFNGANLAGATSNVLTLVNVQAVNGGNYNVRISNNAGATTNASASLVVFEGLNYSVAGEELILSWAGPYVLQSATNAAGPYQDATGATSPATNRIDREAQGFFRLRSSATF